MRFWLSVALGLSVLAGNAAMAQTSPTSDEIIAQLRQRVDTLKSTLAGDVCAKPQESRAILEARVITPNANSLAPNNSAPNNSTPNSAQPNTPAANNTSPQPASTGPNANQLSRKDLADRLHKAVVLVLSEEDTGSGFFITPDTIITNSHVLDSAKNNRVTVVGRGLDSPKTAKIINKTNHHPENSRDYAILRLEGARVDTVLPISLEATELSGVVAAGFPGLLLDTDMNFQALIQGDMKAMPELAMSQGAIMAIQNRTRGLPVIAHSAPISGGNSGGPLVDMCGRTLGINTFINVSVDQGSNAGFAQASNDMVDYLRSHGVTPQIINSSCEAR